MPPKKKVAGDAGKGEKIFKSLCAACHSHAVSPTLANITPWKPLGHISLSGYFLFYVVLWSEFANECVFRVTELVPTLQESSDPPSPPKKDSPTRKSLESISRAFAFPWLESNVNNYWMRKITSAQPCNVWIWISCLYSAALQGKATNKWTEGNLDKYLKSPADYAPGKLTTQSSLNCWCLKSLNSLFRKFQNVLNRDFHIWLIWTSLN